MKIEFTVQDIPPKKGGAISMWSNNIETLHIIALRKAALDAMNKKGINGCILDPVKLEITLFAPHVLFNRMSGYYMGDLDTLIAGVCDGLQAAHSNTPPTSAFQNEPDINPKRKLLLHDDAQIMSIVANRVPLDNAQQAYYKIVIETI